ncbi:MAG: Bro-N domain-containing protein [Oscillospiraceae bacterium]|jgi:prophage antirepressor-like protein|nr:Bro-N domain-containing protein [Oscillospiraceae bacterium]
MQNELKIIRQQDVLGKDFKIYGDFENPLFLAKDVAEWIEYNASSLNKMLNNVDDDEKIKLNLGRNNLPRQVSHGVIRENTEMWFLTEDGLYEVLMQSRNRVRQEGDLVREGKRMFPSLK